MTWLTIGILIVTGVAFFVAAEFASGVRRGRTVSMVALLVAAGAFVGVLPLLVNYGPGDGFGKFLAAAACGLSGLACFWFTKTHVDNRSNLGGFIAATLGLTMFAVGFVVFFGEPAEPGPVDLASDDPEIAIGRQLARFSEQHRALEMRLIDGIPQFRRKLRSDAADVKQAIGKATQATKIRLQDELKEIARLMLALEKEEVETKDLIVRLEQEQRRLERLRDTRQYLGDNDALHDELDSMWQQAQQRINKPLDAKLGTGIIENTQVDQKVDELLKG